MTAPRALSTADLAPNYHAYALSPEGYPIYRAFADLDAAEEGLRTASRAGIPAAFAMIERAEQLMRAADARAAWTDRQKQFLGYLTARAMARLGYQALGIKRAIPHPAFSKGEVYEVPGYAPLARAASSSESRGAAPEEEAQ